VALPEIVSEQEWLVARKALLAQEKELTRRRDGLNADRRRLPMMRVTKPYVFTGPAGEVGLVDLFGGKRQLVIQHVMFGPDWDEPCPGCAAGLDEFSEGLRTHLAARQTTFAAVARAPWPRLSEMRQRRGWAMDFYSSYGSDFNYDYHVTLDPSVAPVLFNYRDADELRASGLGWAADGPGEQPGVSCFLRDGDAVFHTYSTFGRGTEGIGDAYGLLDLTALGRQEAWEEPKDRVEQPHGAMPSFAEGES
jgi:predicted dithiol-disulfide oxidoreductase (DUF899 family)